MGKSGAAGYVSKGRVSRVILELIEALEQEGRL
jgi:hypothetical protein